MKYPSDLIGLRFGRLTVIEKADVIGKGKRGSRSIYRCKCDCGNEKVVLRNSLVTGNTKSCGCFEHEIKKTIHLKHGMAKTRLWKVWVDMRARCERESDTSYSYYGGRGILVCEEWHDFEAFKDWAILHGYDDELTIERKNPDGNYCPENCCWASRKEQNRNRRITKKFVYNNEEKTIGEIAEIEGITYHQAYDKYVRRSQQHHQASRPQAVRLGGESVLLGNRV